MEKLNSESVRHTMELTERALSLTAELAPAIADYWRKLYARTEEGEIAERHDFGAVCVRIGEMLRSLQKQLVIAAIIEELQPGPASRIMVRAFQQKLNTHFDRLRNLLMLSGFSDEADSLRPKRTYFRSIRGLPSMGRLRQLGMPKLLQAMMSIEPRALIEAQLGFMAISGFPDRPTSPQQQRRKRRRRRRANPGAPTASYRPWREDEDDDG